MTTSPRIPVPSLQDVVARFDDLAARHPGRLTRHRYVSIAADGQLAPFDLIATVLQQLGRDLSVFTQDYDARGPLTYAYTRGKFTTNNTRHFNVLWDTIFEMPDIMFLSKAREDGREMAEHFIVYCLFSNVQKQQDKGLGWADAVRLAKRATVRFLVHKQSGFLVQTHGHHADLLEEATALLKR